MPVVIEEGLPPKALWPERVHTLPATRYPVRLNVADDAGYFVYQCQFDDMIVAGGYKIPGPEVEHVLGEHPAAAVAAPDATRGVVPKSFVVLHPGWRATDALARKLEDHVKKELAPYKYPRQVAFVPSLPSTETSKIRRVELQQQEVGRAAQP